MPGTNGTTGIAGDIKGSFNQTVWPPPGWEGTNAGKTPELTNKENGEQSRRNTGLTKRNGPHTPGKRCPRGLKDYRKNLDVNQVLIVMGINSAGS